MRREKVAVLTSLRFPAALAIVLFHFLVYTTLPGWIWAGFSSGVSFFYVLSGFILYYNYVDLPGKGPFWMARFARIWPVHIVTLVGALLLLPWVSLDGHASWPLTLPANIFLLHAWAPLQGSCLSYNGVSWSLSVEAFFYFCFPWLLTAMKRPRNAMLLIATFLAGLVLVLAATRFLPSHAEFVAAYNPVCRLFEFALGMFTCRLWMDRPDPGRNTWKWSLLEAVILVICIGTTVLVPARLLSAGLSTPFGKWLGTDFGALGFAALIWIFAHQAGVVSQVLSARPLEWLGEISFSLYMCHQILWRWLGWGVTTDNFHAAALFAAYLATCLAVSAALFHGIEVPARRAILAAVRRHQVQSTAG